MSKYSQDIEAFISEDDLSGVLRYMKILPDLDSSSKSEISHLTGRLSNLESDRNRGVLSNDEYAKIRNQIRFSISQVAADFELKLKKKEEVRVKKANLKNKIKKNGIRVSVFLASIVLVIFLFRYCGHLNESGLPYKYVGTEINKNSISELYQEIEKDSTLGSESFNSVINRLYAISDGRLHFIKHYGYDSTFLSNLKDEKSFRDEFENTVSEFSRKNITFDRISYSLDYEESLKEGELFQEIQDEYSTIDEACSKIQEAINTKLQMAQKIKNQVDVSFFNVEINKSKRRLEIRTKINNGTGKTLYSVKSRVFIVHRWTGDTLATAVSSEDHPEGIGAVYSQPLNLFSYWNQPNIYNAIKGYKESELAFFFKTLEANVDGEQYDLWFDYRPNNLPYNAYFYENKYYQTPSPLDGDCPYLGYSNSIKAEVENNVQNMILSKLRDEELFFREIYNDINMGI